MRPLYQVFFNLNFEPKPPVCNFENLLVRYPNLTNVRSTNTSNTVISPLVSDDHGIESSY